MTVIEYTQEEEISDLFVGKKIVSVEESHNGTVILLSSGEKVNLVPNSGCWGCVSGNFWVESITQVENVITGVKATAQLDVDGYTEYELFVYTEGVDGSNKFFTVRGDNGNGYYGTGYTLKVSLAS